MSFPGITAIFYKSGPDRWSGVLGWWVPAIAFGVWIMLMSADLLRRPNGYLDPVVGQA